MMRSVLAALFAAPATLGGAWLASAPEAAAPAIVPSTMIEIPTVAAPVFRDGAVTGYFLARVALELGERRGEGAVVPPQIVVTDAVVAHVLGNPSVTFDGTEPFDRERFGVELTEAIGARLGEVRQLYVTQVDFLSKTDIRDQALARGGGGGG